MAEADRTLGQAAYEKYGQVLRGGRVTPWDQLRPPVQARWETVATAAAAAERERIAVLAERHDAFVPVTREDTYGGEYLGSEPFADLIRESADD